MGVGVIINNIVIISLHFEPLAELMEFSLGSQRAACLIHSYVFSSDTPQYIIIMAPETRHLGTTLALEIHHMEG